ncbi:MAG: hypothetical protein ACREQY_19070 [Candidatus Binatia bacterium]
MRSGATSRIWLLVVSWLVVQWAPPLLLAGISLDDHALLPAGGGALLLHHEDGPAGTPHRHSALERQLIVGSSDGGEHEDHLVRLPDIDCSSRPGMPDGFEMSAILALPGPLVVTPPSETVRMGAWHEIGPAPPLRNHPLLL